MGEIRKKLRRAVRKVSRSKIGSLACTGVAAAAGAWLTYKGLHAIREVSSQPLLAAGIGGALSGYVSSFILKSVAEQEESIDDKISPSKRSLGSAVMNVPWEHPWLTSLPLCAWHVGPKVLALIEVYQKMPQYHEQLTALSISLGTGAAIEYGSAGLLLGALGRAFHTENMRATPYMCKSLFASFMRTFGRDKERWQTADLRAMEQMSRATPNRPWIHAVLGRMCIKRKELDKAVGHYQNSLTPQASRGDQSIISRVVYQGVTSREIQKLEKAGDQTLEGMLQLAMSHFALGNAERCMEYFRLARQQYPDEDHALKFLEGWTRCRQGDHEKGEQLLKEVCLSVIQRPDSLELRHGRKIYRVTTPEDKYFGEHALYKSGSERELRGERETTLLLEERLHEGKFPEYQTVRMINGLLVLPKDIFMALMHEGRDPIEETLAKKPNEIYRLARFLGVMHRVMPREKLPKQDPLKQMEARIRGLPLTPDQKQILYDGSRIICAKCADPYVFDADGHAQNFIIDEFGRCIALDKEARGLAPAFGDLAKLGEQGMHLAVGDVHARLKLIDAYLRGGRLRIPESDASAWYYGRALLKSISYFSFAHEHAVEDPSMLFRRLAFLERGIDGTRMLLERYAKQYSGEEASFIEQKVAPTAGILLTL